MKLIAQHNKIYVFISPLITIVVLMFILWPTFILVFHDCQRTYIVFQVLYFVLITSRRRNLTFSAILLLLPFDMPNCHSSGRIFRLAFRPPMYIRWPSHSWTRMKVWHFFSAHMLALKVAGIPIKGTDIPRMTMILSKSRRATTHDRACQTDETGK
jgi:hypothetical protein